MTPSLADLISQRDALEQEIRAAQSSQRAAAIARISALMTEYGLTTMDLALADKMPRKRSKVAPKYRDPSTGLTWTGRGLRPRWLAAELHAGKSLAEFVILKTL